MEIEINKIKFNSKTELQKYIRKNILSKYRFYRFLEKKDFNFICELLKRHPNYEIKKGKGIENIMVQKNSYGAKSFYILRKDNSTTDFSYIECITPKKRITKFKLMCRHSIRNQILDFKSKIFSKYPYVWCPITKEKVNLNNCHVDHYPYSFERIFQEWIHKHRVDINTIKIGGLNEDNSENYYFIDKNLEKDWQYYHKQRTKNGLRILSKKGNLSRSKERIE